MPVLTSIDVFGGESAGCASRRRSVVNEPVVAAIRHGDRDRDPCGGVISCLDERRVATPARVADGEQCFGNP